MIKTVSELELEIDNDQLGDDEIIHVLFSQLRERDVAISELYLDLEDSVIASASFARYGDDDAGSIVKRHKILSKYLPFAEKLGIMEDEEDEPELEDSEDE